MFRIVQQLSIGLMFCIGLICSPAFAESVPVTLIITPGHLSIHLGAVTAQRLSDSHASVVYQLPLLISDLTGSGAGWALQMATVSTSATITTSLDALQSSCSACSLPTMEGTMLHSQEELGGIIMLDADDMPSVGAGTTTLNAAFRVAGALNPSATTIILTIGVMP